MMDIAGLKGLNFGGWLSQCDFSQEHIRSFITENDFKKVSDWGMNFVRLPFDYNIFYKNFNGENDFCFEQGMAYLQDAIRWSKKYGLVLLLDLHRLKSYFFNSEKNTLWTDKSQQFEMINLWKQIGAAIRHEQDVFIELLNEPSAPDTHHWIQLCDRIVKELRKENIGNHIVIESNGWGDARNFKSLRPLEDDKIIYSFHFYQPIFFTHQRAYWINFYKKCMASVSYPGAAPVPNKAVLKTLNPVFQKEFSKQKKLVWDMYALEKYMEPLLKFKCKFNKEIICGEFGVVLNAPRDSQLNWMRDMLDLFEKHEIGWSYWNYKNMDYGIIYDQGLFSRFDRYRNPEKTDFELLAVMQSKIEEIKR